MTLTQDKEGGRVRVTLQQQMQIKDKLDEVTSAEGAPEGHILYKDGWTDKAVAEAMDFPCSHLSVKTVRVQLFGQVHREPGPKSARSSAIAALTQRMDEMEKRMDLMEERERTARINVADAAVKLNGLGKVTSQAEIETAIVAVMRDVRDRYEWSAPMLADELHVPNSDIIRAIKSLKTKGLILATTTGDLFLSSSAKAPDR